MEEWMNSAYAFVMQFVRYRPAAPLDACVDCFWWSQRDKPQSDGEYMLPSGRVQLIFALHDRPFFCAPAASTGPSLIWSRGIVHGPQSGYYISGAKPHGTVVGVSFRPGGAGAILGIQSDEVVDRHVLIDDLWGTRGTILRERLQGAESPGMAFGILDRELTTRLLRPLLIHPAIAQALSFRPNNDGDFKVAELQRASGYSPRHFIALFRTAVGLTPKHYFRIQRFTAVLKHLANADRANLADLAASTGYSDQAHMTREFRALAGVTPTRYQPQSADSIFHQRVADLKVALR